MAFSGLKKLVKKTRKAIGLPPITLKNTAIAAAPFALGPMAGAAGNVKSVRKKLGLPAITLGNAAKGATGAVGKGLSAIKNNPMDAVLLGLAGANAVGAVNATKRANSLADSALDRTRAEYAARAPMRERGMQQAMNPARPDLTDTFTWQGRPRPISATARVAPPAPADVRPSVPAMPMLPAPVRRKLLPAPAVQQPVLPDPRLSSGGGLLKRKRGQMNALLQ